MLWRTLVCALTPCLVKGINEGKAQDAKDGG